jgi:uncharacterized cupin superfamily protein
MPKVDRDRVRVKRGPFYAGPLGAVQAGIVQLKLHEHAGLADFGVNLTTLPPGAWTSHRHWHSQQDEFVWVVDGEVVLVEEAGETVLRTGDCAGFKAGVPNAHHLQNRSSADAVLLEIGSKRADDATEYPDVDAYANADGMFFRDGTRTG